MPFTLAHPAAVLLFPRNRFFHFPALVLGAMSPDFLYFLMGKPTSGGHSIFSSEWLNLPLCLLFYVIYRRLLEPLFNAYLPRIWAADVPRREQKNPFLWLLVFGYSAWFGMLTHIGWDAFTHKTGYFVEQFAWLQQVYLLPVFKWLQYSGGVLGLLALAVYQWRMARRFPAVPCRTARQKINFWLGNTLFAAILVLLWQGLQPLPWVQLATHTIRAVDSFILSLLLHSGLFWCGNRLKKSA